MSGGVKWPASFACYWWFQREKGFTCRFLLDFEVYFLRRQFDLFSLLLLFLFVVIYVVFSLIFSLLVSHKRQPKNWPFRSDSGITHALVRVRMSALGPQMQTTFTCISGLFSQLLLLYFHYFIFTSPQPDLLSKFTTTNRSTVIIGSK